MTSPPISLPAPRLTALFLASALGLVVATAALTIQLTGQAVEHRVESELLHTARLIGGSGFPLNDQALERVANFIGADVVATDAEGQVVASSLDAATLGDFQPTQLPGARGRARIFAGRIGGEDYTLGVAPTGSGPSSGAVFVLYPADLIAAQSRAAWLPVVGVAVLAVLLAVLLGAYSERRVRAAQTSSLIRLLASVAHEVRNPLGAIRTLARSARQQLGPRPEAHALELIEDEAERLTLLTDGLRCVGLPVRTLRSEIDPDQAVEAVFTLLAHQLEHRRVRAELALVGGAKVSADAAQVRQVVLNLVLNAADAMPAGGVVRCASALEGGRWRLTVEDEGPGVAPEVRARLFAPFVSTKSKGLGVGLYLSRRLAAAHGATLECAPSDGRGARFVASWPLLAPTPEPHPAAAEPGGAA
ncbi:MAG: HAMP domain-containing histidine kinase [Planctomycetes bacterium]|nr:HAMP domain-containing histidine kinase [Planctomycetota bacterium]